MSDRVLLVVNPWATKITPRVRALATRVLAPSGLRDVIVTRAPGEAGRRIREEVADGVRTVVCLGGDGTLAEVAGALVDGEAVTIPLPGGSTNVFARAVGWPASLQEAPRSWVKRCHSLAVKRKSGLRATCSSQRSLMAGVGGR